MHNKRLFAVILCIITLFIFAGCVRENPNVAGSSIYPKSLCVYDNSAGTVDCTDADGNYIASVEEGGTLQFAATLKEGYGFAGWSKGNYLEAGGELISEESSITVTAEKETKYYANFLKENEALVLYDANGGTVNDENAQNTNVLIQKIDLGEHKYPMTISQNGTFTREGYNIVEYTSEADGSGVVTNIGQRALVPNNKVIKLYVQWAKESDESLFSFEEQENGYYITKYSGEEVVLSVPSKYNGKDVVGISSDAITSAKVETVVLPSSIQSLDTGAFNGCPALTKVYLFDTIAEMTDDSFTDCPIQTVCVNSAFDKYYFSAGTGKLEVLCYGKNAANNRMVVTSGSSSIYALDSELLQSSLNKDYAVINFALQISVPNTFAMSVMKPYLNKGDTIVLAPEAEAQQFCNKLSIQVFTQFDGTFTQFRNVDISKYEAFFSSLSVFSLAKQADESLVDASEQFYSENGDVASSHDAAEDFPSTYTFRSPLHQEDLTDLMYRQYNAVVDDLKDAGVTCYLSFAPFCAEACNQAVTDDMLDEYSTAFGDKLNAIKISNQSDYNYPKKYFFEMYHMINEGKTIRTQQLADDLNAQFEKE